MHKFETPILLMIFNRPETTRVVFEELRRLKPTRLFIAADGPRPDRPDDAQKCTEARKVIKGVDWPCEVKTLFRDKNLGCKFGPSSNITWFFKQVEEGIIIEDDCVPHPSFFQFCEELLHKYRDDHRVAQISGNNLQQENKRFNPGTSYYFSILPNLWGWATWRRSWDRYTLEMPEWPEFRKNKTLLKILRHPAVYEYWARLWDVYYAGQHISWDRPWAFTCIKDRSLTATSSVNLISNIGFGVEATHTTSEHSKLSKQELTGPTFPLTHPSEVSPYREADDYMFRNHFSSGMSFKDKVAGPIRRNFPQFYSFLKKLVGRN